MEIERRNFIKIGLVGAGAAVLTTQSLGVMNASPAEAAITYPRKGFGYPSKTDEDIRRINSLNLAWWYNWNQSRGYGAGRALPLQGYVPMLWSDSETRLANLDADLASANMPVAVLGFNEPDLASQSNMTTAEARKAWRALEKAASVEKLRIGSPVTISPNAAWMDQFMTESTQLEDPDLKIDFVTAHIYQNPDVNTFLRKIDTLHDKWGKPVWVTETAVADFSVASGIGTGKSTRYTRAQVNEYMGDLWPELKKRPWLERFAWKTRNVNDNQMWFSSIFNDDGSLTSTGIKYRDLV